MADRPRKPAQQKPGEPPPSPGKSESDDVPDVVLEELLAAFSAPDAEAIDFDDPSIDRLLGLSDSADSTEGNVTDVDETDGLDKTAPAEVTDALTSSNTIAL